jgi:hypothetical protein
MLRVWMIACMTMVLTGCCDWPRHEWTGVVEMEPSVAHSKGPTGVTGEFAVLAIESGPDYRKPDCITTHTSQFPERIGPTEGGGRRPYLVSYDGASRTIPAEQLPVGQRVRVRGFMHVGLMQPAREERSRYGARFIERQAGGDGEKDYLEHVLVVEKMWVIGTEADAR